MPVFKLTDELLFPPTCLADEDGLLAFGGDLSLERLKLAYSKGIFPWYNDGEPIQWWSPNPRFVLFPEEIIVSRSMRSVLRNLDFSFAKNQNFKEVIHHCKTQNRTGQLGTWITDEMEHAYINMHKQGFAHSAECYFKNELVGGMYGIKMGKVFFGESMFSLISNASKYAFIKFIASLQNEGIEIIDCQVYTPHLESLGARLIAREEFEKFL